MFTPEVMGSFCQPPLTERPPSCDASPGANVGLGEAYRHHLVQCPDSAAGFSPGQVGEDPVLKAADGRLLAAPGSPDRQESRANGLYLCISPLYHGSLWSCLRAPVSTR